MILRYSEKGGQEQKYRAYRSYTSATGSLMQQYMPRKAARSEGTKSRG